MLNIAALNGRLTADPELRHTTSNIPVTTFTLAVDRSYVKADTERQADFINIVCWRGQAEFASKYFRKGQLVAVDGMLQTRTYTDSQGNKRKAIEVVARNLNFAEPRKDNNSTGNSQPPTYNTGNSDYIGIDNDDDLPF